MNPRKLIKNIIKQTLLEALAVDPAALQAQQTQAASEARMDLQKELSSRETASTEKLSPRPKDKPPADPAELEQAKRNVLKDPEIEERDLEKPREQLWNMRNEKAQKNFKEWSEIEAEELANAKNERERMAATNRKKEKEEKEKAALKNLEILLNL
jgi:hypothetical protein